MGDKKAELIMGILVLAMAYLLGSIGGGLAPVSQIGAGDKKEKITIVVDPGHGGDDPGKVGINQSLEKDLNLAISLKLRILLEESGVEVVMTRENKEGLYQKGSQNKKQQDMKKRCELIDQAEPVFTVSIHQNSYTAESVHGPQVFYYSQSQKGEEIASYIQDSLNQNLQVDRPRDKKANDSYYLLKKTKSPTIIVECGFLSNRNEAEKLVTGEYQVQVAQAIYNGIDEYLKKARKK